MPRSLRTADIKAGCYRDASGSLKQLVWAEDPVGNINPYWSMKGRKQTDIGDNLNAVAALKYSFTPWLYLQVRGRMSSNHGNSETKKYWDTKYINDGQGEYDLSYSRSKLLNGDILLGFDKDIATNWHISSNLGSEIRDSRGASLTSETGKLVLENRFFLENGETVSSEDGESHTQFQSVYGTAQIGYHNYVFLDATARNDWASTLPSPYDYFYPSVGLTGVISDMVKLPEFISFAKVRGSYAEVGNGAGFAAIYQTYSRTLNGTVGEISPNSTKVPANLVPERTKQWEAGAELRFLRDRFGLDFTWYKGNTYNQLVYVTLPPTSGYSNGGINCGNVQNKGIEVMFTTVPVLMNDLKWEVNVNFTRNENKVIDLTSTLDKYPISAPNLSVGDSWIVKGKPYGEIYSRGFMRNDEGKVIVANSGVPKITAESETYLGNYHYDWQSGLTSNLRYKNWDFYFLIDLNYGGVRQSATEAMMLLCGTSKASLKGRDGGFVYPGVRAISSTDGSISYVDNDVVVDAETYCVSIGGRSTNGCGEPFNHKATNSRLRELSLGYTLPWHNALIKDITVSAVGRNLFYIYNACKWFDPDVSYDLGKNGQGSESAFLPGCRNIGFNIKVTF
ncbi:MAG: TonB-dependent receptor [Bacteroidales bacterium]|nr:TonB-dependent receptor [Bacteroidales bacterium]